jgi:hypothetical protein
MVFHIVLLLIMEITYRKENSEQYCNYMGIRLDIESVAHPQSNGKVERMNGLILRSISLMGFVA